MDRLKANGIMTSGGEQRAVKKMQKVRQGRMRKRKNTDLNQQMIQNMGSWSGGIMKQRIMDGLTIQAGKMLREMNQTE